MSVKFLDNTGTQYIVNKIKAVQGEIPSENAINALITAQLTSYKEGIVTIVSTLPASGEEGKLYLVVDADDTDVYVVYTWENNAFKRMGAKTFTLTIDSALSSSSTNPVQNKVVKAALDAKVNSADVSNAGATLAWNSTVTLATIGDVDITAKLPANPDTNTKMTQTYSTTNNSYPLLMTATAGVSSTASRGNTTGIVNNSLYANPSTGAIYATHLYANGTEVSPSDYVQNSDLVAITTSEIDAMFTGS